MNEKRKLPPGIQKPTYELPPTDDYARWAAWMIRRNEEEYAHKLSLRKIRDTPTVNNENVIQFHEAQGIRKYN